MGDTVSASELIKKIRSEKEYSQEFMAAKLNIKQQSYSAIENNPENASLKRLKAIANILDVKVSTLIGEEDTYIFQNFNQSGGQAATQMQVSTKDNEIYERYIVDLKLQIDHLKNQVDFLMKSK